MDLIKTQAERTEKFIQRWEISTASERATSQSFIIELCELLEVPRPHATADRDYMFERALKEAHAQAQNYARALPAAKGRPPIILVGDVGQVIQLYSEFCRTGGNHIPLPA